MIDVGPFVLRERLGKGGTGHVWRATHRQHGVAVALKVIRAQLAQDERVRQLLRNEIRALAQLNHPGIITLLDVGQVSEATELASAGDIIAGSPYIAMELAGGTLAEMAPYIRDYEALRACLLQLLDALAHAHARGVIHRDIKPMNVLTRANHGQLELLLADFGVAHALRMRGMERQPLATTISGTPRYMAPEQVRGESLEQGPWTDLYALGCVAFWLSSGETPFSGETGHVLWAHVSAPVPPLKARFDVPAGFEEWLGRLLAKAPADRYRFAADAAYDLRALSAAAQADPSATDAVGAAAGADHDAAAKEKSPGHALAPRNWRQAKVAPLPPRLQSAGISLFHLRPIPLVSREVERDALWHQLLAVAESKRPSAVMVHGEPGVGKSALVRWLSERAHELGAAQLIHSTHAPINGRHDGLAAAIAHVARAAGLDREAALSRLSQLAGISAEVVADTAPLQLLADVSARQGDETAITGARQRDECAAMIWLITKMARQRPLILWIDDAQWSVEETELCQQLLALDEAAVLTVLTIRDDCLDDAASSRATLNQLSQHPAASELALPPLSRAAQCDLVKALLPLDDTLAQAVADRSEGNPLFAAGLLGDWIDRGLLVASEHGFSRSSHAANLPDSIHAVWLARLSRLDETLEQPAGAALEIAAALGQQVDEFEWFDACREANQFIPAQLVDHLIRLRLARRPRGAGAGQWAFVHGMLRESLARRAEENGSNHSWHRACARVLARSSATIERAAQHLLYAEAFTDALQPLLDAAEACSRRGDFALANYYDDLRDHALDRAQVPSDDLARLHGWLRRARTDCLRGDAVKARAHLNHARAIAADSADASVHAALCWVEANLARHDNDFDTGIAMARKSLHHHRTLNDRLGVARCHKKLGEFLRITGAIRSAIEHYQRAQETFSELGDHFELAWTSSGLSSCHRQQGNLIEAHAHASRGLLAFIRIGSRLGIGHAHNELGEAARLAGRFSEAEAHYRQVIEAWQHDEHRDLALIHFNIAMAALGAGDLARSESLLIEVLTMALTRGRRALETYALAGLCACSAMRHEWRASSRYASELAACLAAIDLVDVDIAQALTRAAHAADEAGQQVLCERLVNMALPQWQTLGDSIAAAELQARLRPRT